MNKQHRKYLVSVAAAVSFLLVTAACADNKGSNAAGQSDTSTPAPQSQSTTAQSSSSAAQESSETSDAPSEAAGSSLEQVCAAGEQEGALIVRKSTDPDLFEKEIAGFKEKYPGIKVDYGVQNPENSIDSVVAHKQSGRELDVDLLDEDISDIQPLIDLGYVAKMNWADLDVEDTKIFEVNDLQLVRTQRIVLGLGYNTKNVNAEDLPNTWEELIDAKWAGKVVIDPRGKYLAGLSIAWGKDKAVDWYKRFVDTAKPMLVQGATASVQKVISGEALLTTSSHDAEINEQGATGAPIDIKYLDVVPTADHYAIVLDGAPHANAAACFISWFASKDGGEAAQLQYEFKNNETEPSGLAKDAVLAIPVTEKDSDLKSETAEQFAALVK